MNLDKNKTLQQIEEFARNAHSGQMRKYSDEEYIIHPIRVMKICQLYTHDIAILSTALLHDVLEDTKVTSAELEQFLSGIFSNQEAQKILQLTQDLTDVFIKENYPNLNRKQRKAKEWDRMESIHYDAQTVKYADIIDNSQEILVYDPNFARVYLKECLKGLQNMKKGNSELYQLAFETVQAGMKKLHIR
ncbi:MAG: HD domain-containing protein [Flavobacteriaceae bacterium]|nr:HD domain-containing protein [Flavobacteriaceae bacterium]